jgi:hypothetical protein
VSLPASFAANGFGPVPKPKFKGLMLGTDGLSNTGKTEFALSAPGPTIGICLDRGHAAMLDNPHPPPTRRNDYILKVIKAPLNSQATIETYREYWRAFYEDYKKALGIPECRTVLVDGDSDSWELQRLAEWGKLAGVGKSLVYAGVNAARRAMYARAFDSGKIVIATNKSSRLYKPIIKPDGTYQLGNDGKPEREWDGKSYERQGFSDQDYLWQVQITHLYNETKGIWGLRINRAKADPSVQGLELWGYDCNFQSLVQTVYPNVPLSEWGY